MSLSDRLQNFLSRIYYTAFDLSLYKESFPAESLDKKRFYNIGAGNFYHPYWKNIDGENEHFNSIHGKDNIHIIHQFFDHRPFPVESNHAEIIYTSHTIEHLDNASVIFLFKECYRILKPGGLIRIVTPDVMKSYKAWRDNHRHFFFWTEWETFNKDYKEHKMSMPFNKASLSQIFLDDIAASASVIAEEGAEDRISDEEMEKVFRELPLDDALDYCISRCTIDLQKRYPDRHSNWFHENKLRTLLQQEGFVNIVRSAPLKSQAKVMRNPKYFDRTLAGISIFMEAGK